MAFPLILPPIGNPNWGTDVNNNFATLNAEVAVVQMKFGATATPAESHAPTWLNTALVATITPKYATSRIILMLSTNVQTMYDTSSGSYVGGIIRVSRNGVAFPIQSYLAQPPAMAWPASLNAVDTPATTAALTYTLQIQGGIGGSDTGLRFQDGTLILLETR